MSDWMLDRHQLDAYITREDADYMAPEPDDGAETDETNGSDGTTDYRSLVGKQAIVRVGPYQDLRGRLTALDTSIPTHPVFTLTFDVHVSQPGGPVADIRVLPGQFVVLPGSSETDAPVPQESW